MSSATPSAAPIPLKPSSRKGSKRPRIPMESRTSRGAPFIETSEQAPNDTTRIGPLRQFPGAKPAAARLGRTNGNSGQPPGATGAVMTSDAVNPSVNLNVDAATGRLSSMTLGIANQSTAGRSAEQVRVDAVRVLRINPSMSELHEQLGIAHTRTTDNATKGPFERNEPPVSQGIGNRDVGVFETRFTKGGEGGYLLTRQWTLYYNTKFRRPSGTAFREKSGIGERPSSEQSLGAASGGYEASLKAIGSLSTVEEFRSYSGCLKPPSQLERNSNYFIFKDGIKPIWEDPANSGGGKWTLTMRSNPELLDSGWRHLAVALIGEEFDERDEICGVEVSLRAKIDRVQLWLRSINDVERINSLGEKFINLLDLRRKSGIGLEFEVQLFALRCILHLVNLRLVMLEI